MEVRTISLQTAPASVKNRLFSGENPEAHWAWFTAFAESALDPGEALEIASLMDGDDQCRSALPVIVKQNQMRSATSWYTTKFTPPLGTADDAYLLGKGLAARIGSEIALDSLSGNDAATIAFLGGLRDGGLVIARYQHFANWHTRISDFSAYWETRSSSLRTLVKRKLKRLAKTDSLRIELVDLTSDWQMGAALYESIYAKSWKEPEKHAGFITSLLRHMGPAGLAHLGIAHVDGQLAAAQIWLVRPPRATLFKLAQDPAFDTHSPGTLLTHWMLQRCLEKGARAFDFGRGDDAYKRLWFGERQFRYGIIAVNPRTLRGMCQLVSKVVPTRIAQTAIVGYLKAGARRLIRQKRKILDAN